MSNPEMVRIAAMSREKYKPHIRLKGGEWEVVTCTYDIWPSPGVMDDMEVNTAVARWWVRDRNGTCFVFK